MSMGIGRVGVAARRSIGLLFPLLVGLGTAAGQVELEAGAAALDGSPAGAAALALAGEGELGELGGRAGLRLQGRAGAELAGSAEARGELSLSGGAFTGLLRLEAGLSGTEGTAASWRGAGGLELLLDGLELSAGAKAGLERRSEEGLAVWIGSSGLGLSFALGEALLKPGLEGSLSLSDSGSRTWTLLPGLGLSWYPGFPLSLRFEGGWRRLIEGNTATDSLLLEGGLDAALGPLYLGAGASLEAAQKGIAAAEAAVELRPELGRLGPARLALPLRLGWVLGGSPVLSLFAGLSLGVD